MGGFGNGPEKTPYGEIVDDIIYTASDFFNGVKKYSIRATPLVIGGLMTWHACNLTLGTSRPEIAVKHDELKNLIALEDIVAERIAEGEPKDLYNQNYINARNRQVVEDQLKAIEESKEFSQYNIQKTVRTGYLGLGVATALFGAINLFRKRKEE